MDNTEWKLEKDLLAEAYNSLVKVEGTDGSPDDLTDSEKKRLEKHAADERAAKGLKAQGKQMEEDLKEEEEDTKNEEASIDDLGEPVESIPGEEPVMDIEPDEVDAEIESLKSMLQNPDQGRIEQYAKEGKLEVYITMLQKKLDAAKAVKDVIRGDADG